MYAHYLPASASEFPNDNPELHDGARWVCQLPVGPARAVLRATPAALASASVAVSALQPEPLAPLSEWLAVTPPVRCLQPAASPATQLGQVSSASVSSASVSSVEVPSVDAAPPSRPEPFALEPDAAPPSRPAPLAALAPVESLPAAPPAGPLQLDLSRIVLPHRVANVPPPPAFIFRPLPSSRRAAAARAVALSAPPLAPLGYRVVDQRDARRRVQRLWRVDVAPCLAVAGSALAVAELEQAPPSEVRGRSAEAEAPLAPASERIAAIIAEASSASSDAGPALESAAVQLIAAILSEASAAPAAETSPPEGPATQLPPAALLVPVAPEPPPVLPGPSPAQSPASGRRRKAQGDGAPDAGSNKKQRRRAVRVASSASLVTAALPGNAELSRTLSSLEADFAERRLEQPASARKRRNRRGAGGHGARAKRAANAV